MFDVPIAADGAMPGEVLKALQVLGKDIELLRDGVRSDSITKP